MDAELMTVRDVARACQRSEETVRRWIWSGKLPATKLGNQLFVKQGDVQALNAARTGEPRASYRTRLRSGAGEQQQKRPFTSVEYDPQEMIAWMKRVRDRGKRIAEKYGPFDVSDLIHESHEDH